MEIKQIEKSIRRMGRTLLGKAGYRLLKASMVDDLRRKASDCAGFELLLTREPGLLESHRELLAKTRAQIFQDIFVLAQLGFKRDGFFVEFGATDGVSLSNTFLLENSYNWQGIVAEPARIWHSRLKSNRKCYVDTRCVWKESNQKIEFSEAQGAELSTVLKYVDNDHHRAARANSSVYMVETVSLVDLLNCYGAPPVIDYLSLDTEGSEYDILESFDFSKFRFRLITCEHNYTKNRDTVFALLSKHGYERILPEFSRFEDWYRLADVQPSVR